MANETNAELAALEEREAELLRANFSPEELDSTNNHAAPSRSAEEVYREFTDRLSRRKVEQTVVKR